MSRTGKWFLSGEGIAREVVTADIQRYLGPDALVRPGRDESGVEGYYITAYRTFTTQMVADLKLDSQRWRQEVQQGRVNYQDSSTHRSRQFYGPTDTPAPQVNPYPPPAAQPTYPPYEQSRPPPQQAYREPAYTYAPQPPPGYVQQGNQYVPIPGYNQPPRTTPGYPYGHSNREPEPQYQQPEAPSRYAHPSSASAPPVREHVYQQPQTSPPANQYTASDGRTYSGPPPATSSSQRRR